MRNKISCWQILSVLIVVGLVGCAFHSPRLEPESPSSSEPPSVQHSNPGFTLPAVIKYPETTPAQTEAEAEEEKASRQKTEEERLAQQPKVSNFWQETDLRAVLQDISAQTGVNIFYDDTVEGIVTMGLKDVPLEKALEKILFPRGYTFKRLDDYYLVGPGTPGMPFSLSLSETEIMVTNRAAEEVVTLLSPDLTPFIRTAKGGYCLSISAPPEVIERIKKDLALIDSPQPQLVIEVLVCETKSSKERATGIDWSQILDLSAQADIDLVRGAEWAYAGIIKGNLLANLNIMAQKGDLDIKANPRIVTINGQQAEINVTREKYVILYESGPRNNEVPYYYYYPRFEAKPVQSGVILKVTPRISREGDIILTLEPEVSDLDQSSNKGELPIVNRRGAKTMVRVKSGETVVIGGLYQELSREMKRGVPVLSRIPLLNFFFQRKSMEKEDTEVVIFVTPTIFP